MNGPFCGLGIGNDFETRLCQLSGNERPEFMISDQTITQGSAIGEWRTLLGIDGLM